MPRLYDEVARRLLDDVQVRLTMCGATVQRLMEETCRAILLGSHLDSHHASLSTLLALANDHLNAVDYHAVQKHWLDLYVDASMLLGMVHSLERGGAGTREAVRKLDMATIVAGGSGRETYIEQLIDCIQKAGSPRSAKTVLSGGSVKETTAHCKDLSEPFIIRGHCNDWPAIKSWKSPEYLLDCVGEGRVVPVEVGSAYVDEDWGQRIISFRTLLARCGFDIDPDEDDSTLGTQPLYLAQHSLFKQFPRLERDVMYPDYVWSEPQCGDAIYQPLDQPQVNVWIGNSASHPVSPAHTDPHFNCYTQVLGRKRVWLAPPSVGMYMYAHDANTSYLSNTSTVPIFRSHHINLERFPDFSDQVIPLAREAVLEPGDLLVMPPGWWHAMKGQGSGPGWSISMWY